MGREDGEEGRVRTTWDSLCSGLNRKWGQEDRAFCSPLLALGQGRFWWGLGLHQGHSYRGLMRGSALLRGSYRGSWLEISGVHWMKARQPLRSETPQKPVVVGDSGAWLGHFFVFHWERHVQDDAI